MKIAKRISILVFLAVCLFAVERNNIIEAHSSCPERDQCYDTAYANYTECINDANLTIWDVVRTQMTFIINALHSLNRIERSAKEMLMIICKIGINRVIPAMH